MTAVDRAMTPITSEEQCRALIRACRSRVGRCDTNCPLIGAPLLTAIDGSRLFYRLFADGLVLYSDEGSYYETSYFWRQSAPFADLYADKPVSVVEINPNGRRDSYLLRLEPALTAAGFEPFKRTLQLEADTAAILDKWSGRYEELLKEAAKAGYTLMDPVPPNRLDEVLDLWESELDEMDVPQSHTKGGRRAAFLAPSGEIASAYWWRISGASAEGRHIVTHPSHTRRGLAVLLILYAVRELAEEGTSRLLTYISDDNVRSLRLHEKIGFKKNGRTAVQYILKRRL